MGLAGGEAEEGGGGKKGGEEEGGGRAEEGFGQHWFFLFCLFGGLEGRGYNLNGRRTGEF